MEYRLEPARCRPVGTSGTEGPRAAPAPASAPDWKRPQPDLCRSGEDKIGQGYTGSMWVRGTTYAQAAGAGAITPDQAAQILARLAQAEGSIAQLPGAKVPPTQARERGSESELMRVETEVRRLTAELQAATERGLEQDKQILELQAEAKGHEAEIQSLRAHMGIKTEEIERLQQAKADWMSRSYTGCMKPQA